MADQESEGTPMPPVEDLETDDGDKGSETLGWAKPKEQPHPAVTPAKKD